MTGPPISIDPPIGTVPEGSDWPHSPFEGEGSPLPQGQPVVVVPDGQLPSTQPDPFGGGSASAPVGDPFGGTAHTTVPVDAPFGQQPTSHDPSAPFAAADGPGVVERPDDLDIPAQDHPVEHDGLATGSSESHHSDAGSHDPDTGHESSADSGSDADAGSDPGGDAGDADLSGVG